MEKMKKEKRIIDDMILDEIYYGVHLCSTCVNCFNESYKRGDLIVTHQDPIECPYAEAAMDKTQFIGAANNRSYVKDDIVLMEMMDNGGGFNITKCNDYRKMDITEKLHVRKMIAEYEAAIHDLIGLGVSPDKAADNMGYIMYAMLGGEARKTAED